MKLRQTTLTIIKNERVYNGVRYFLPFLEKRMEEKGKNTVGGNKKKGIKLLSILDKLRHSVPDTESSASSQEAKEHEEAQRDTSALYVDENISGAANNIIEVEDSTSEQPDLALTATDGTEKRTANHSLTNTVEAIIIEDETAVDTGLDIIENENVSNQSFIKVSSNIVSESCESIADDADEICGKEDATPLDDNPIVIEQDLERSDLSEASSYDLLLGTNTPSHTISLNDKQASDDCPSVEICPPLEKSGKSHIVNEVVNVDYDDTVTVIPLDNEGKLDEDFVSPSNAAYETSQKLEDGTKSQHSPVTAVPQDDGERSDDEPLSPSILAHNEHGTNKEMFDNEADVPVTVVPVEVEEDLGTKFMSTKYDDAGRLDVEDNAPVTVVPLDDEDQLEIDSIIDEDGQRLVRVWTRDETVPSQEDQECRKKGLNLDKLTEDDLPSHVNCTACGKKMKTASQKVLQHPVLSVLICKTCSKFYNSSSFSRDQFGMEEFCKWCGDGGKLVCCDFCEKVYCRNCVKRNMGPNFLKILLDAKEEKWKCFFCDPSQIDSFTEECSIVMKILKRMKMKGYAFESKKTHLGGPSQFERKERLKNISHTLEDEGVGPNEVVKIEIDPDLDLSVNEVLNDNAGKEKSYKDSKIRSSGLKKLPIDNGAGHKLGAKDDEVSSFGISSVEIDLSDLDVLTTDELRKKYMLKDLKVLLDRIEVPVNCTMPTYISSADIESDGHGSFEENYEEERTDRRNKVELVMKTTTTISLISSSDDEVAEDDRNRLRKDTVENDHEVAKNKNDTRSKGDGVVPKKGGTRRERSIQNSEGNGSDLQNHGSEVEEDDDVDMLENESDYEIKEEADGSSEDEEDVLINSKDSSDSEFDYQRLANRSIRRNYDNKKEREVAEESNSSSDDDEKKVSSSGENSEPTKRTGKRKRNAKGRKKNAAAFSNSDSDVLARTKKRPRRKRKNSEKSTESENESRTNDESGEDEENIGRTKGKKKGKTRKGKGKLKGKGRKRKGKVIMTDSNESSDDDKSPSKAKGRKNIRRILADEELTEETRKARQLEEERRRRLLDRTQATYNEEQASKQEGMAGRLVLEVDKKNGKALVEIHESLVSNLKPHQVEGIQFMYDCLFESVEKFKNGDKGSGALLAHCMGLGKSLQIIALLHAITNNPLIGLTKFLVVAPLNTVYNWQNEFEKWLEVDERMDVYVLTDSGSNLKLRMAMLKEWHSNGGVMILGYEMYRNMTQYKRIKNKKHKKTITETLLDPGPDIVVCDEGHILRNDLSAISKALTNIKTLRRVVLTGTPLQNNLLEYFVMVSFVKPKLLGTKKEFTNLFMNPIQNGQCANSTPGDVKVMKQRCHVLHDTLSGCVQRKDYSVLTPFLTPKHEYTLFVRLGERQRKMYQYYLDTFVCGNLSEVRARGTGIFADYQCLMKIWTHPWAVKLEAIRRLERENLEDIREFLNDSESEYESSNEEEGKRKNKWRSSGTESEARRTSSSSDENLEENEEEDNEAEDLGRQSSVTQPKQSTSKSGKSYTLRSKNTPTKQIEKDKSTISLTNGKARLRLDKDVFDADGSEDETATIGIGNDDEIVYVQPKEESVREMGSTRSGTKFKEYAEEVEEKEWYDDFIEDGDDTNVELSGKLVLLLEILANAEIVGDKILVFSQSLSSLDLIERTLGGGKIGGNEMTWCKGVDYFRLDGSTAAKTRQRYAEIFNDVDNTTARLFIISTKAGSLGVNLVAANRVIVFDCSWNPSHDVQSIFRVYRFGQDKPVYVYRLISQGTMEEKIYERQINKLALAGRVVDEQQISRHFTDEEIKELYAFTAEEYVEGGNVPVPQLPADPLLAEVLQRQHPKWIIKYHEHDILLENIEGEQLTEEERRQAWANYEEQKDSAARAVAREGDRMRLYQERLLAFQQQQQQQQQQQIAEMQLREQQQRQNIDNQIHQHQEMLMRLNANMQSQGRPAGFPQIKVEAAQRARPPMSAEDRIRDLQIINLSGLGNQMQRFPPWMQTNMPQHSVPMHPQNMIRVDQRRPPVVDLTSRPDPSIGPVYRHIPPSRSAANLRTDPGIRIIRVGSLPRNASFPNAPRGYMPPRG